MSLTISKRTGWRGRTTALAVVLVSMLALQAATATSADAFTYSSSGRPGGVTFPSRVTGAHDIVGGARVPYLTLSPVDVSRSPATSGAQIVTADYDIYRTNSNGVFVFSYRTRTQATIPAGFQQARQPIMATYPKGAGYFQVRVMYTWWTSQGTQLGQTLVNFTQQGDYRCASSPCTLGAGWIYLASL